MEYDLFSHAQRSAKIEYTDRRTIDWLVTELGFINDSIILGDIINVKSGIKFGQKKIDQAKIDLAKDGITDSFFLLSDFGGVISLSYEYKFVDGYSVKANRIIPRGQLR